MQFIGDHALPLPFALLPGWVAGFFRVPFRFVVVFGFGAALLEAALLETIARRLPRLAGMALCAGAALVPLVNRGASFAGTSLDVVAPQQEPIYERVREVATREGSGPLLDLPLPSADSETFADSMVASLRHGQPLILGYTGHPPGTASW